MCVMLKGPQSSGEVWEEVLSVLLMVSVILHCDIIKSHKIHVASSDGGKLDGTIYAAIGTSVLIITLLTLLCIIVLLVRWSYKKHRTVNNSSNEPYKQSMHSQSVSHQNTKSTIKMIYPSSGKIVKNGNANKVDSDSLCDISVANRKANLKKMSKGPISYMKPDEVPLSHHRRDIDNHQSSQRDNNAGLSPSYDVISIKKRTGKNQYLCGAHHRENTSKMEIDPAYQSTAGHNRAVEIYDLANIERETSEADETNHHGEDTVEVEIDPAYQSTAVEIYNVASDNLCHCVDHDEDHKENTSKMEFEIDPAYQSTAGPNRAVEIYDVTNTESDNHDLEAYKVTHHKEDTVEVEIDPAYQSTACRKEYSL